MAARNAKEDADRIIAKMERAAAALERVSKKGQQGQPPPVQGEQGEGREPLITPARALTAYNLAKKGYEIGKGVNRATNITELASMGGETAFGKGSMGGLVSRQVGNATKLGTSLATGNLVSAGLSVPDMAMTQFNINKKYGEMGAEFVKERFRQAGAGFGALGSAFGAGRDSHGLRSPYKRGEESLADVSRGIQHFGRAVGGPVGGFAAKLVTPSEWLLKSTAELRDFADKLHASNMQFSDFSQGMMQVKVQQQIREMELSHQRGERRALSAGYNVSGKNQLDQTFAKVEDFFAVAKGFASGGVSRILNTILEPFSKPFESLTEALNSIAEKLGIDLDESENSKDMFAAQEEALKKWRRPERHRD